MAEGQEDTVTLTITAGDWGDALQNQAADANAVMLEFTGTPIADSAAAGN
jgi:type I site-specific restriction-modification system R (restriction) subunit